MALPAEPSSASSRASRPGLLVVLAAWLAAVVAIDPRGQFPMADDWVYAHVVRSLLEGRGFDFLPWTGASLFAQALYGAAACLATGFSHQVLRLTTLVLSAGGIAATHALLVELGATATVAAAGAATVAFSPIWLSQSFTFMTDVPFASLAIAAAWLYARSLRTGSRGGLFAAGLVAAVAFFVRQHAVWIAGAAALAALMPASAAADPPPRRSSLAGRLADAAAALALPAVAAVAYTAWALTSQQAPLAIHNKIGEAAGTSLLPVANAAFRALVTLGFLLLPWSLVVRPPSPRRRALVAGALVVLGAGAALVAVRDGAWMFYLPNVLGTDWIGALTTRDTQFLAPSPYSGGGSPLRAAITVVSVASAAMLVAGLADSLPSLRSPAFPPSRRRSAVFVALALALSALGSLAQAHYYFDRYLMAVLPLTLAALAMTSPGPRPGPAFAAALALMSAYAVAGTHDYMEWNRARWSLLGELEAGGVTARQIDGGFEYNAERLAAEMRTAPSDAEARRGQSASKKSWWWVDDDEWVIAFGPLDGYRARMSRSYARWLPPGRGEVFALHRLGDASGAGGDTGREGGDARP